MQEDIKYAVWLSSIEEVGAKRYNEICAHFGGPQSAFLNATYSALVSLPNIGEKTARLIIAAKSAGRVDGNMELLQKKRIGAFMPGMPGYPALLGEIFDAPPVLYCKGEMPPDPEKPIAMVGTRKCTRYGRSAAQSLARELAGQGVTIISGLARGIDTQSHTGALEGGGTTIAVLGCGVDQIYPPENKTLYERICENGAVISDYFPGTLPLSAHFPARNRIISGMSRGVVVVESGEGGGALITVDFALEQGRDIFAVPGNIDSPASCAPNRLIREGAVPVCEAAHILEEYEGWGKGAKRAKDAAPPEMDMFETGIYELLEEGPLRYDELAGGVSMDDAELLACLTMMELRGIIKQLPGRAYELNR